MAPSIDSTKAPEAYVRFIDSGSESSDSGNAFEEQILEKIKSTAYLVDWYGPEDKGNPQNLPKWRKWFVTMSLAWLVLATTFSSSVFGVAATDIAQEYHTKVPVAVFGGTGMFMLGFAVGPVIFGPLSEWYGRKRPLVIGFTSFMMLQLPVAQSQSLYAIFFFRFLQGVFGSAPSAILSGTLADIWTPKQRGFAMPSTGTFLMIGPSLGPMVGSEIVKSALGWRWIGYVTAIGSLVIAVITLPALPETYSPTLLASRASRLRHMTQNWALRAKSEEHQSTMNDVLQRCLSRPAKMLVLEPILLCMCTYISVTFGLMYIFFLAYPMSFARERQWEPIAASLPLLSILIGVIIAGVVIILTVNTSLSPSPKEGRPQERRLILMMIGAICLPGGMFWFAATSSPTMNPWPQLLAGVPIGVGIHLINMQGMNYIVDCYGINANSAIAALTTMRSLFAAGFPVFATPMYASIGVAKSTTYLAFFAVLLAPIPFLFYRFGDKIRARSKWVPT